MYLRINLERILDVVVEGIKSLYQNYKKTIVFSIDIDVSRCFVTGSKYKKRTSLLRAIPLTVVMVF